MTTPITTPASNQTSNTHQSIKDTLASLTTEEVHAKFPAVFAAQPKQTPEETALATRLRDDGITPIAMFKRNIPPIADLFSEWVTGSDGKKTRDYTNGAKRLMTIDLLVDTVDKVAGKVGTLSDIVSDLSGERTRWGVETITLSLQVELYDTKKALTAQNEALTAQVGALTTYVNDLATRLDAMDAKLEQRATMPRVETQGEAQGEAPTETPTQPIKDLSGVPAKITAEMSKVEKALAKARGFTAKNPQPVQAPVAPAPVAPTALAQSAVAEAIAMDFGGDLAEAGDDVGDDVGLEV